MLRAGIIGAGAAGRAHARALAALGDTVRVVGVHDNDPGVALHAAGELSAEPFERLDDLFRAVDCVVVASPTDTHAEYALRAAAAGIDSLVERPVVPRAQDVARLQGAIARAATRPIVQAGHLALFSPVVRTVVRVLAPHETAVVDLRHEVPRTPESPTVEQLLHDVLTMLPPLLRSTPVSVSAAARRRRHGGGIEHLTALIAADNGAIATINVGHLTDEPRFRIDVLAEKARVIADQSPGTVTVIPRGTPDPGVDASASPHLVLHPEGEDPHVAQARSFVGAVAARSVPVVPLAAALPALELTEHVLRRAEMGERLRPGSKRRAA